MPTTRLAPIGALIVLAYIAYGVLSDQVSFWAGFGIVVFASGLVTSAAERNRSSVDEHRR